MNVCYIAAMLTCDPKGNPKSTKTMEDCKAVERPFGSELERLGGEEDNQLEGKAAALVRGCIARVNYLAQDRVDLQIVSRILSQHMASPTEGCEKSVKRVA